METLIIRTCAFYGRPVVVNGVPTRSGWFHEAIVEAKDVVNDPNGNVRATKAAGGAVSDWCFDDVLDAFEAEHDCKVSFDPMASTGIIDLEVFEPEWDDGEEAIDVINELSDRVVDWVKGLGDVSAPAHVVEGSPASGV